MKRKLLISLMVWLLVLGVPAFFLIRGVIRWSLLESVTPSTSILERKHGNPIIREFEPLVETPRTDFGPFSATLPPSIIKAFEIEPDDPTRLYARTPAGAVGVMNCEIVERGAYLELFEIADALGPSRPWASAPTNSAADSEAIACWWHLDSYHPPEFSELLLLSSEQFQQEFVSRTAWATLVTRSDSVIEYVVTDEAVARIVHWRGIDDAERQEVELYSRSSKLLLRVIFKSDSLEWATDHALAFVRSFVDNTELGISDSEIHQSLIDMHMQRLGG